MTLATLSGLSGRSKGNDKMTLKQFLEVVKVHSKCYRLHSITFTLFSICSQSMEYDCVRGEDDLCSNNAWGYLRRKFVVCSWNYMILL